jgi:hypothetical protein
LIAVHYKRKMENQFFKIENRKLILGIFILLCIIALLTNFYGSSDTGDYSYAAKFFAGKQPAKIRSSHSYLFGFIHAPLVSLTENFVTFKITSLIFLFLIILSVYYITNKDKKALWLILLSPVVWYMAPWISPIQLSGLLLLWAYHFLEKYDRESKIKFLAISGILIGLGWAIYDTIFYFGFLLAICFLWNKKLSHSVYFLIFLAIGLLPRLILDYYLFNFPFFSMIKSFFGGISNMWGGIYNRPSFHTPKTLASLSSIILAIPLIFWKFYKPGLFKENKKTMIFLSLSMLLLFINPQIRYSLLITPIFILIISKNISESLFKKQIIFSVLVIILFITPYLIQINYSIDKSINGAEFTEILEKRLNITLDKGSENQRLTENLNSLSEDYPDKTFVVGSGSDDFQVLAGLYWGDNIQELVSSEDYNLYFKNSSVLFEKKFMPVPNIRERRQWWLAGGINKNENDETDYQNISFAISIDEPAKIPNFKFIKRYGRLYLSGKS